MIVVRAPLRISFVGGGSDLPAYLRYGKPGFVVSATIEQSVYVTLSPSHDGKTRLHYKQIEEVDDVRDLQHDRARVTLDTWGYQRGIEVHSLADLPAGSGLGSSSAFTVALTAACAALDGMALGTGEMADLACSIEIHGCGHPIGYQDAYASAYGGLRSYTFMIGGLVEQQAIPVPPGLQERLWLLPVGGAHDASQILRSQGDRRDETRQMARLARRFEFLLSAGNLNECGRLLGEAWRIKRKLAPGITSPHIDDLVDRAYAAGAQGVKLLGAGGAGYLLCWMPAGTPMPGAEPVRLYPRGVEVVYASH